MNRGLRTDKLRYRPQLRVAMATRRWPEMLSRLFFVETRSFSLDLAAGWATLEQVIDKKCESGDSQEVERQTLLTVVKDLSSLAGSGGRGELAQLRNGNCVSSEAPSCPVEQCPGWRAGENR